MYILAGYGKMTFASDDKYIGYWRDGMRHGKVYNKYITMPQTLYLMLTHTVHLKSYSFTKTVVYVCIVMLQKPLVRYVSPASQGRIVYSNGDFFEGMFKEGQIEGEGGAEVPEWPGVQGNMETLAGFYTRTLQCTACLQEYTCTVDMKT